MSCVNEVSPRKRTIGWGSTYVPEPWRRATNPSATSASVAWRTVIRAAPQRAARSRSDGSRSPGRALATSSRSRARIAWRVASSPVVIRGSVVHSGGAVQALRPWTTFGPLPRSRRARHVDHLRVGLSTGAQTTLGPFHRRPARATLWSCCASSPPACMTCPAPTASASAPRARGRTPRDLHGDPDLLGHVYVGPYIVRGQGTQLVVVDEAGVCGYLLSTDDTDAHHVWAEAHWWPALRARYPDPEADARDAWLVRQIHQPPRPPAALVAAPTRRISTSTCWRGRAAWAWAACSSNDCWTICARGACRRSTWARPGERQRDHVLRAPGLHDPGAAAG